MYRDSFNGTRYDPKEIRRTKGVFTLPNRIKTPSLIFTSSLTDFFHPSIDGYRNEAWDIIRKNPQHIFQILTKRPERITDDTMPDEWHCGLFKNVWIGTSVGSQDGIGRIEMLARNVFAPIRFVSFEPMYGPIDLTPIADIIKLNIQWAIIGGESGNESGKYRYRPCKLEWIESLKFQLECLGVSVFVKQLGNHIAKELSLKDRHGGDIDEFPNQLKVRSFPATYYTWKKFHRK